jgi:hypothetical protein
MSDFPAMDWHELAESHDYWRRRVMQAKTPYPMRRNGPIDRAFVKNYITFTEAVFGRNERSHRGRSISRHDA